MVKSHPQYNLVIISISPFKTVLAIPTIYVLIERLEEASLVPNN